MRIKVSTGYYNFNIEKIEKKYNAKYLGDFEYPGSTIVLATFYAYDPDKSKGHSHYFGLYVDLSDVMLNFSKPKMYITNAAKIAEQELTGVVANDGEVVVSCYRHHYNTSTDQSVAIDGGRDYTKTIGTKKLVKVKFNKDKMEYREIRDTIESFSVSTAVEIIHESIKRLGADLSDIINQDGDVATDGEVIDQIVAYLKKEKLYKERE